MNKYICIHGHFYQPPRENAWLETIEQQDSAYPFHDWNERINSECYGPNAASRILNDERKIVDIVNNYSRISFNFGPTLLSWIEENANDIYRSILAADQKSIQHFSGHGSALAQVYNHMIMPLANKKDKVTQTKWGIEDFRSRFNRDPEGIWLAETAVDLETLEVIAEQGIKFTVLAPRQMNKFRKIGSEQWHYGHSDSAFTARSYLCKLPSGNSINLFFYNGDISQSVAFKGLLKDGKELAKELYSSFKELKGDVNLTHIATDGESYGHHHKHGDMALAFCLHEVENNKNYFLTNYGEFLSLHPPEYEVEIHESSSWSCVHGVERWRADCGCNSGKEGYHQKWREPLRDGLDALRDKLLSVYEKEMPYFTKNIWKARDEYIRVIIDRDDNTVDTFIQEHCQRILQSEQKTKFIRLLEMQRHAMLMYTSCGWFFDDISGIETVQILQYANRAIQLAEQEGGVKLNEWFKKELEKAPSNNAEIENGKRIYEEWVEPKRLTLSDVAAHYAVNSLFSPQPEELNIWNYQGFSDDIKRLQAGDYILSIGKTNVYSKVTYSVKKFQFAVLYLGQSHIIGSMSVDLTDEKYYAAKESLIESFKEGYISETIGRLQQYIGQQKFSIWNLFRDDQQKVLSRIAEKNVDYADKTLRNIYNRNYNLMRIMDRAGLPIPILFRKNMEAVVNHEIISLFKNEVMHPSKLENLVQEVLKWEIPLDKTQIEYVSAQRIYSMFKELRELPSDIKLLNAIFRVMVCLDNMNVKPNLIPIQNIYFQIWKMIYRDHKIGNTSVADVKEEFDKLFRKMSDYLNMALFAEVRK